MPTTTYTDSTFAASVLGARTDNAGVAVVDTTAEEARILATLLNQGYLTPASAFVVAAQASPNMSIKVGSGTAKADYYVVSGTVAGQGNYIVRHDVASVNVTIGAADASQTRTDEIYLVVQDNLYDTSARVLPRIGYRKGDVGGANPGADASWKASVLLARVTVPAAATTITSGNISDQRAVSTLLSTLVNTSAFVLKSSLTAKGDLITATAASTPATLGASLDGRVLMCDSTQSKGLRYAPIAVVGTNAVGGPESTTSTTYTNLATFGPSVTLTVGPAGIAIVSFSALMQPATTGDYSSMSYQVSGANSIIAGATATAFLSTDPFSYIGTNATCDILYGLTPGSTTFTMKYKAFSGSATFSIRDLKVVTF